MNDQKKSHDMQLGFKAIRQGNMRDLKQLVKERPDIIHYVRDATLLSTKSYTLLSYAYERKNFSAVKYLVQMGANVNVQTSYRCSGQALRDLRQFDHLGPSTHSPKTRSLVSDAMDKQAYDYIELLTSSHLFSIEQSAMGDDEIPMVLAASIDETSEMHKACKAGFYKACQRHFNEKAAQARQLIKDADKWEKYSRFFETKSPDDKAPKTSNQKLRR